MIGVSARSQQCCDFKYEEEFDFRGRVTLTLAAARLPFLSEQSRLVAYWIAFFGDNALTIAGQLTL